MATWTITPPTVSEIRAILAAYSCTASVSGTTITVTHSSGSSGSASTPDGAIRVAIELARRG